MAKRWFGALGALAVLVGGLSAVTATPAAADATLTLDKKAPASVLLGDDIPYELTASNAGPDPLYNVSFSDVLPPGFEYVGPTDPASAGEPTATPISGGRTLLVWSNVTDLQGASSFTLEFAAKLKPPIPTTIVPVDRNTAYAAGSINARKVPKFNSNGTPVADAEVESATDIADTARAPFKITKSSSNSPEGELLRGVHDQVAIYTLKIENNKNVDTNDVFVTDYLPAQLEFLGCGDQDNSSGPEYPGAPPLGESGVSPSPCPTPVSVETVKDPTGIPGLGDLSGVYTAVTWNVGNLASDGPDRVKEIKYAAGIPLFENTTDWAGGTAPDADCGQIGPDWICPQSSNLDNNTNTPGGSTREGVGETPITNEVSAQGVFAGTAPSNPVTVTDEHTVTIEDVRMQKSVAPEEFTPGGTAVFTMNIEASEYMNASDIVVTDTLPNGYCPLGATGTTSWAAEPTCTAQASDPKPSPGFSAVPSWDNDSKTYNVVFQPVTTIEANGSATVTLPARMLSRYRDGDGVGAPTVAGDNFVNTVELTAQTNAIEDSQGNPVEPGEVTVEDTSRAEQGTPLPSISKQIKPRAAPPDSPGGMKCDPDEPPFYVSDPDPLPAFRKGDVICFKLRVDFPDTIDTKNAVVTDFPPFGTEFVVDDEPETGNNPFTLIPGENNPDVDVDLSSTKLLLTLGDGGFVARGGVFEATFAVRVLAPGAGTQPEITGNLMKMRTENTAGVAQSYRDQAEYELVPPPDLGIQKGVYRTFGPDPFPTDATYVPPGDDKPVRQGGRATFQVDVTNRPREIDGADYSVRGLEIWDVLPGETPTINCSSIVPGSYTFVKSGGSPISLPQPTDGALVTCEDAQVRVNGATETRQVIKWTLPNPDLANTYSLDTNETLSLRYTVNIPTEASVSTEWNNTAYVRTFNAFTDIPNVTAPYFPADNIDPQIPEINPLEPEIQWDSPALLDPSSIHIKDAEPGKSAETSLDEAGNDFTTQATIGETIWYTYSVTIPDGSTVYQGTLSDVLPDGIQFDSVVDWGLNTLGNKPAGFSVDTDGTLSFPNPYSNNSGADQTFRVKVKTTVLPSAVPCTTPCVVGPAPAGSVPKKNTATFTSYTQEVGGTAITKTKDYTVNIVQPNPGITKTVTPEKMTSADEELTVTLDITNSGDTRPPLHNWEVKDCLPSPFALVPGSVTAPTGITQTTDGQGCLVFTGTTSPPPTDPLNGGVTRTVSFKIKASSSLPATQQYENKATLTGTSMPGTIEGERTYTTEGKDTWTSPGLTIAKATTEDTATIGQRFTSKISVDFDKNLDYYSAKVVDTLPAGVNPASVNLVGITCKNADTTDCGITGPQSTSGQQLTWTFGDITSAPQKRTVTIEYTAVVADIADNKAGVKLTNSARPYWSTTQGGDPTTTTTPVSDTLTIVEPDLSIVKKVDGEDAITATPGQEFTYTLKVSNASGENVSAANSITVTDDIPAGIEVVGTPSDGGQVSGSTITWTISSLAPGADKTLSFTARLKAPATGKQTNTATVSEYYSLPNEGGRKYTGPSDTADVTPVLPALTIVKDASAALAYIDEPYTWTIVVTNSSGATAYGVDVADTLPPNWSYKADSAEWVITGGTPAAKEPTGTAPDIAWNDIADLPTGKTLTITFQAIPGEDVVDDPGVGIGTEHINSALTTWTLGPAGQGWGTGTSEPDTAHTEIASADLALVKTHDNLNPAVEPDEVVPGTEFEWILKTTNNGPDTSVGPFTLTDTLPAGVEYRGYSGTGWSCNAVAQVVTCTNPGPGDGLVKDESLDDLVLTVYVDPATTGDLKNTAEVTGRTYDPNPDNNKAEDVVTARPLADVAIVKSRTQPYVVGGQVTYTLAVTNLGPSVSVKDITVEDTLPAGLSIASIDSGAWDCTPKTGPTDTLTCVLDQDLAPDAQADLIKVTVDVLESPGDTAVNTATVTPTTEDPNLGNNTSTVEDPVVADVQLGISKKTTGANPVTAGTSTEFTITVTNAGPAKAKNVQVVDQLEPGLRATSASGPGWTCDVGSGTVVTCTRANFPVSASPSDIVITADVDKSVPGGTTLKNTATVTTTSPQEVTPDPATSTVEVVAKADLAIVKTHQGGPWTIGKQGTWNVKVTNNGPSDNPGPIRVTDNLPKGNEYVSGIGDGWTCTASGRTVVCELPAGLLVGQSAQFSIRVNVVSGAFPEVVNPAEVTSPIEDTDPSNDKATDSVRVEKEKQTADRLPPNPSVLPATNTKQGQKIRTKVRCRPLQSSAAGEASYCKVRKAKNGTIRVKVVGSRTVLVIVTQYAKGTKDYEPFKRVKKYRVKP